MKIWVALLMVVIALGVWGGFGALVSQLSTLRTEYAGALERSEEEALRGESAARVRAAVEGTVAERAALKGLVTLSILRAVEVIEQAGDAAGASNVSIGEATPIDAPKDLAAVRVVVNADGSFTALMRAIRLFETLPIPASLEQFELEQPEGENSWRLTAHLRILMTPTN